VRAGCNVFVDLWNRWCWKTSELFPLQSVRFVDVQTYVPKNVDMVLEILNGQLFLTLSADAS
jgi:hypothetical protein